MCNIYLSYFRNAIIESSLIMGDSCVLASGAAQTMPIPKVFGEDAETTNLEVIAVGPSFQVAVGGSHTKSY